MATDTQRAWDASPTLVSKDRALPNGAGPNI
jgi:hypothetical protein